MDPNNSEKNRKNNGSSQFKIMAVLLIVMVLIGLGIGGFYLYKTGFFISKAKVTISSEPPGADIYTIETTRKDKVIRKKIGITPLNTMLPKSIHELTLKKDGYFEEVIEITIDSTEREFSFSGKLMPSAIAGIDFVRIPSGAFIMGSASGKGPIDEFPKHKVLIDEFIISSHEITQKQFKDITGYDPNYFKGENMPADSISWHDAVKFCRLFTKKNGFMARLPYEAEWEYACRAGTTTEYYWGDKINGDYCWYYKNSGGKPHPVGRKKPNAWGLYDMCGNLIEWCIDYYDGGYYRRSPGMNPKGPESGLDRVLRGGSYTTVSKLYTGCDERSASRGKYDSLLSGIQDISGLLAFGFRIVIIEN